MEYLLAAFVPLQLLPGTHRARRTDTGPRPLLCLLLLCCTAASAAEAPLRIAVISDINGRYGQVEYNRRISTAMRRIVQLDPDLVICTGDVVAGQRPRPKLGAGELDTMWRSFHETVRLPLQSAAIPLLMTPGNHDASAFPAYSLERERYRAYHTDHPQALPPLPGHNYPFHYAVRLRNTLLVAVDATVPGALAAAQRDWLRRTLQEIPGNVILFGHLPLQPVAVGREREVIDDAELEALLSTRGVSAWLSGHHHAYYPGWRDGIAMLSTGNLAGNRRPLLGEVEPATDFSFSWMEVYDNGEFTIHALAGSDFTAPVDAATLPPSLGNGRHTLRRFDLAPLNR